jgi:hypothetical protein
MKTKALFLIIVLVSFISCKGSPTSVTNSDPIVGEWKWTNTVGGIGGWTYTSASEGYTCRVIFRSSDFSLYFNDTLVQTAHYNFVPTSNGQMLLSMPDVQDSIFIRHYPKIVFNGLVSIAHDSLNVSPMPNVRDGFTSLFIHQ